MTTYLYQLTATAAQMCLPVPKAAAAPHVANVDPPLRANGRVMFVIRKLVERRPSLFALHTPAIGQLSGIDARLYSHLFQCEMVHRAFEDSMEARRAAYEAAPHAGFEGLARFFSTPTSDSQRYADWQRCVEHAALANYFLDRLVFSRWPRWCHRVRMVLRPNEIDRRSATLIKTGTLPAPAWSPDAAPAGAD